MSKRKIAAFAAAVMMIGGMGYSGASTALSPMSNVAIEAEAASTKTTKDFVTRMYKIVLNRNPDTAGLNKWVSQLNKKQKTAADLVNGFFYSDEYKSKKKSAPAMIIDCYRAMLDRTPDTKGMSDWKKRFSAGMTIQAVCKGFVGSDEFKKLCASYGIAPGTITPMNARDDNYERTLFVRRLYENCLGRDADIAGLESWCMKIRKGATGSDVAKGFVFSSEHLNEINKLKGSNFTKAYITDLYCSFLGRTPDAAGLKSWTEKLLNNNSLQYVFNGFVGSDEFKQQCAKAGINAGGKISDPGDINPDAFMNKLVTLINNQRANNGTKALSVHPTATKYAKLYVGRMAGTTTERMTTKALYEGCGLNPRYATGTTVELYSNPKAVFNSYADGEKFYFTSAEKVFDELMNNSKHSALKNALLNSDYKYIGAAAYEHGTAYKYLDPYFVLVG